jgi:hypothetical protein
MTATKRVDLGEFLQGYSRKLLHDFREGAKSIELAYDRGEGRENAIRQFFAARLPRRYGVGEGIVFDSAGAQSKQCDVVVYDRERTPRLSDQNQLTIWPFESVYSVAEVKSKLTKAALKDAVENIAEFKSLTRPENNRLGGNGVYHLAGLQNPAFGMLIAHEEDGDVKSGGDAFKKLVRSVDVAKQIDAYCVLTGGVGCRGIETPNGSMIGLYDEDSGPLPELFHYEMGDGALAGFLFLVIAMMNGIRLGEPQLLRYLTFLPDKPPPSPPATQ